jgi:hypothetical protein
MCEQEQWQWHSTSRSMPLIEEVAQNRMEDYEEETEQAHKAHRRLQPPPPPPPSRMTRLKQTFNRRFSLLTFEREAE